MQCCWPIGLLAAWLGASFAAAPATPADATRRPAERPCQGPDPAAASCGRCHPAVHAEWSDSAHAKAFTDPVFRRQLATRRVASHCLPCHVPAAVLDRLGKMPGQRSERRDEGVTCVACHLRNGVIHGPNGGETDAHRTIKDLTFSRRGSFSLCTSCHDSRIADVLPLGREFSAAGLADDDQSCIGCHMDSVRRAPARDAATGKPLGATRNGRSHRLRGPGDVEFCASAFDFGVERGQRGLIVTLANGAGHGVPGLARLRSFPIRLAAVDAAGEELAVHELTISWEDRLLVGEERRIELRSPPLAVAVHIVVDHVFDGRQAANIIDQTLELP